MTLRRPCTWRSPSRAVGRSPPAFWTRSWVQWVQYTLTPTVHAFSFNVGFCGWCRKGKLGKKTRFAPPGRFTQAPPPLAKTGVDAGGDTYPGLLEKRGFGRKPQKYALPHRGQLHFHVLRRKTRQKQWQWPFLEADTPNNLTPLSGEKCNICHPKCIEPSSHTPDQCFFFRNVLWALSKNECCSPS